MLIPVLIATGIFIALFGIGVDYLLPNASPGINLVQLLIIVSGLTLSICAWLLRRPEIRRKYAGAKSKSIAVASIVTLLTLVALELVLSVAGMSTYFPVPVPDPAVRQATWSTCDEPGCHYDQDQVRMACDDQIISGRVCTVNRQGYADSQDFLPPDEFDDSLRILALGDSFTFGSSADIGKSYVNYLEARFPDNDIWNTGISGSGTNQAIAAFKWFAPQLRPQLTTLGFVMNDFNDNLLPIDSWIGVVTPERTRTTLRTHYFDVFGNVYEYDPVIALRYAWLSAGPPRNSFEYALGLTRLGTLVLRFRDGVGPILGGLQAKQISTTREYLLELRDLANAHDSDLLVLIVPDRKDFDVPGTFFRTALELMEELGIPYLNPSHLLDAVSDYAGPLDGHWSTAGHQKVGRYLSECIEVYMETRSLFDCDNVVATGSRNNQ